MALRLTKRQQDLLAMLASGHTDRETYLKLKISESQFHDDWQAIGIKVQSHTPETIEDFQTHATYERVERFRLEAEVWAGEARLTALMDTSPEAVMVINGRSGRILKANNRTFVMFGYSPKDLIGKPMEMLIDPELRSKHGALRSGFLNSVRKRELGYHPPIYAVTKEGKELELDIALTATMATDDVMVVCRLVEESETNETTHIYESRSENLN